MSKRRLNKRQSARIIQRQQRRSDTLEAQNNGDDGLESDSVLSPGQPGIVACHYGQQLEIEALAGPQQGWCFRCYQRSNLPALVCGDKVVFQTDSEGSGVVIALEERRSLFSRPNSLGELKPVAANIDQVLIVIAPVPIPFMNLIDRYLVAVESLMLTPVLVVNKSDLIDGDSIEPILALYPALGYQLHQVSAQTGQGIAQLNKSLAGATAVIVGQSGVGKSSLINALSPAQAAEVGALSASRSKGTHTTTTAKLFHLESCDLIDSPGIREFSLWHIDRQQLLEGFIEFRPFLGKCRFRDCSHGNEPGCALQQAVISGEISQTRLASYFHILESLRQG